MNAPAKIAVASPSYIEDPYGWAFAQAELLRQGRLSDADWNNIIEEIESVGRSERRSLDSNLFQVALHMLKWDAQPERRGNSWWHSIQNHCDAASKDLRQNPSLRPLIEELVREALADARLQAARETGLSTSIFDALEYDARTLLDRVIERPDAA